MANIFFGIASEKFIEENLDKWTAVAGPPNVFSERDENLEKYKDKLLGKYDVVSIEEALKRYPDATVWVTHPKADNTAKMLITKLLPQKIQFFEADLEYRKGCSYLGNFISYRQNNFSPCCITGKCPVVETSGTFNERLNHWKKYTENLIDDIRNDKPTKCHNCHLLAYGFWRKTVALEIINLGSNQPGDVCNFRCVYCFSLPTLKRLESENEGYTTYDIIYRLSEMPEHDNSRFTIQLANGEVCANKNCDKMLDIFLKTKWKFNLLSNCSIYKEKLASLIETGRVIKLTTSLDSGTRETFKQIKKNDRFDKVIENLKKYPMGKTKLYLKYIFLEGINDNETDIDGYYKIVKDVGGIIMFSANANVDSPRYTEKMKEYVLRIIKKAKVDGIEVTSDAYINPVDAKFIKENYTAASSEPETTIKQETPSLDEGIRCAFDSNELQNLLGGYWYLGENQEATTKPFFTVDYFAIGSLPSTYTFKNTCLIAMTNETWLKGTKNTGHFAKSANESIYEVIKYYSNPRVKNNLSAIISEVPIPELRGVVPQLIVEEPYEAINTLAVEARKKMENNGKIIAVAGAVGKSTTVNMLNYLLNDESDYISNLTGHNSRTGTRMWLASVGRFAPKYGHQNKKPNVCTIEVAESALWESKGGVCEVIRPHIGIVTHVALTQWKKTTQSDRDVALVVSKVCSGIVPGGHAVLYRDMPYFDLVKEKVIEYGAIPISYGETDDCDVYVKKHGFDAPTAGDEIGELTTSIEANVLGEDVSYKIGTIGKPVVLNSLAALTAAKLAGFDIKKLAPKFADFKGNKNVLQVFNHDGICVINNSHNLEVPSIIAAFDLLKQIKQKPGTRKIVLMSRIDNLEEKAAEIHLKLTEPIINSGFDQFFFHEPLDEFSLLVNTIPTGMSGGRYGTLDGAVGATTDYIRRGDSILVIGSHFTSDFGNAVPLLKKGIDNKHLNSSDESKSSESLGKSFGKPSRKPDLLPITASVAVFSSDKNSTIWQKGKETEKYPGGLSLPLLLYYFLDLIRKGELSWLEEASVNEHASKEAHHFNSLGLSLHEKVPLITLFKAAVVSNSPDAITAIAGHIYKKIGKSKNGTVQALRKIGKNWGIPDSAVKNVSGRYFEENPQFFTIEQLLKVAMQLLSFDKSNMLSQKSVSHKSKYYELDFTLDKQPVSGYLSFSSGSSLSAICKCEFDDETVFIAVCGAKTPLERDMLLMEAIHRSRVPLPKPHKDFIPTEASALTICGDTYCGERYTKWRIARNIEDPIQKFGDAGYAYSFEKVAPLISPESFNIVNSECVLSPVYDEPQQTGKYIDFVLGGHPEKTIKCYKDVNINAVMLANNHAMDFDVTGCRQTRKYFKEAGLSPIGTGSNVDEAEKPLMIKIKGKQIIIFNAYCYFLEKRYKLFKHYCLGANTGTAFGTDIIEDISLWRRIRAYREKYPKAFIVFSPHWSTDFNKNYVHLRTIAEHATDAGADIIIGHGPHVPVGMEYINDKACVYSIGNFVFNTTGIDLDASGQSPYSIVAKINFTGSNPELRLYPIYAHNLNTFFQPYPVNKEDQLEEFTDSLMGMEHFETEKDDIGYYIKMTT